MARLIFSIICSIILIKCRYSAQQTRSKRICFGELEIASFTAEVLFAEAAAGCSKYGGILVKIGNSALQDMIRKQMKVKPMYFIGAKEVKGQYIWLVDKTRVPLRGERGYQLWRSNEPNNAREKCVAIGVHGTHEWSDVKCEPTEEADTNRYSYICQRGSENLLELSTTEDKQVICAVASDGVAIHWTKNSKAVKSSVVSNGIYQKFEANRAHLHIVNANLSEIGTYECVSKTGTCSAKKGFPVTVGGNPNIIKIYNNTCNSSLLIEWKPAKPAVGFRHRINVFNNITNVTKYATPTGTEIQKDKVIGLDLVTNYTVEIQACLKSCETEFRIEIKTTTNGITDPVSSANVIYDNKEGCRTSWEHTDTDSTFSLQINCSVAASRKNARKFNLSTIEGIIDTSYNFQPFPNRKCEVKIQAKGCGKISGIVNASGTCNTPVELPQSIKPLLIVDGENDASKIVEIAKPNEDNGLISCVFIILCYQTCPSKSFTMDDLRAANKSNGVNTTGKRNEIALAIPIPSFTESSRTVKLGNGKLTYCDVHALWHDDISSASTNETFQGRNNLNGSGEYIGAVIVTTTPSNRGILLKSSDTVTVVGKREPTSASPISTASIATVASGPGSHISNVPGWVIGLIIGIAVLLILVVAVALLIRKKRGALRKPPEDQPNVQYIAQENEAAQVPQNPAPAVRPRENQEQANIGRVEEVNPYANVPPDQSDGTDIRVSELEAVYNSMRKNGNATFNRQYNNVLQEAARITKPTTAASTFMKKNRYKNILPFDDCRVPLTGSEEGYINASYINGFTSAKKYIATQGPLRSTVADFWMMAMEQNSHVIVMLTKEYDAGKKKCEKYWPDLGKSLNFSNGITVESRQETSCNAYIERILVIRNKTDGSTLVTYQYQFMKWPDHGVPQTTSNLIRMHRIVTNKINELQSQSPIIVHCSAGAGRTGAFLTYDYLLKEVEETGKVDVYRCVVGMRNQRIQMVQNADQYTLIYKLLVEAHIFVDYDFATDELKSKVANLESRAGNRELEREFRELGRMEPMKNSRSVGMEKKHRKFNRGQDAVPYDYSLVSVVMTSEETEPPYINASFIESYDSSTKMIAAQGPFDNTIEVFWRVVLDRGVTTIVMLNPLKEGKEEQCARYWPAKVGEVSNWGEVGVVCRRDRSLGESISERTLEITRGTETKTVTQFHFTGWKENSCPDDPSEILDVINKMQKHYRSTGEGGAVLIHCNDGIGRTGAFCTIVNLIDRVKWENRIDVFRTVKDLRDGRPNMVKNLDQYHFCYKAIANYLKSFELYANF